jgi:hypothetical protein
MVSFRLYYGLVALLAPAASRGDSLALTNTGVSV